jgi:TIR domain
MSAKLKCCWYKWYTFQLSKCAKITKWLPISINRFLGSGHKFSYRLWEGGTLLHYQKHTASYRKKIDGQSRLRQALMAVKIFFSYAHEDEPLLNKLKAHLRPLHRQGLIDVWYDRNISGGSEWEHEISNHLDEADIILLLISPDFMDSDYCYGVEMKRALERHERREAHVIPIILRYVLWHETPLRGLTQIT